MHKLLLVSLSAALISVRLSGIAEAAYTQRDVDRMEDLIAAGNWVDLRIFLLANPQVLNGSDPFTQQLQRFLDETDSLYTALTFDPSVFPDINQAEPTAPPPPPVTRRPARDTSNSSNDNGSQAQQSGGRSASGRANNATRGSGAAGVGSAVSIY